MPVDITRAPYRKKERKKERKKPENVEKLLLKGDISRHL